MRSALALTALFAVTACGRSGLLELPSPLEPGPAPEADAGPAPDAALPLEIDTGTIAVAPDAGTDASADTAVPAETCGDIQGLFAYYPLDGDLRDHSAYGHDATGSVTLIATGKLGGAASFDGASSFLRATGADALPLTWTMCAWVNVQATTGLGQPLFSAGTVDAGDFFSLAPSSPNGGTCPFLAPDTPFIDHWGTPCYQIPGFSAPPGAWHLICYAYDDETTLTFSTDGKTEVVAGSAYANDAMSTLFFGSTAIGGTTTRASMLGTMDEITVWGGTLSTDDFNALWNDGHGCKVR
jgi:predicted small lipoprotein YifL